MSNPDIAAKFAANMGVKAPFHKALREWNDSQKLKSWCVPARGTKEHDEVMKIMRDKYLSSSSKKANKDKNDKVTKVVPDKAKTVKQTPQEPPTNVVGKRERKQTTSYNPRTGKGMKMKNNKKK